MARSPQGDIDLRQLMRGMRARKWWILGPTLAALALTFAAVTVIKPRFTADAKVLLENQDSYFTRPDKESRDQTQALDPEAVQSQVQLISSRDLARQAAKALDLASKSEFDPLLRGVDPFGRVLVLLGLQKDPASVSPEERVLESYFNKLTVYPVSRTRVLSVEFVSNDPDLAAQAANTIADLYLSAQGEAKKANVRSAATWLLPAIQDLRAKVQQAEAQVADFRARSGLQLGNNNTTISNQQLSDLTTQMATARAAQAESQARSQRVGQLLRQGRVFEISDVVKDDLIRRVSEQRVTLKAQLALEARTLLPGHPRMKELQAQLADVEGEMRQAGEKVARSLEGDAKVAAARVRSIEATLEAQKKIAATGDGEDVRLRAYEREAKSARDQLESYLQKYREATAREGGNAAPADARIISRAFAPQLPSFPKKLPMLLIAGLGTLFLSSGLALARLLLSGTPALPTRDAAASGAGPRLSDVAQARAVAVIGEKPPASVVPMRTPAPVRVDRDGKVQESRRPVPTRPVEAAAKTPIVAAPAGVPETLVLRDSGSTGNEATEAGKAAAMPAPVAATTVATVAATREIPDVPVSRLAGLVRVVRELRGLGDHDGMGLSVLVTGLERATGATTAAIALGRSLSREAAVVIVDLDLQTPGLDALVDGDGAGEAPVGLADVLAGEANFHAALQRDMGSRLHVLPAGAAPLAQGDLRLAMAPIVEALRRAYDFVILDAASPKAQPETLALAELSRAVVVVAPHPQDSADEIVALLRKLPGSSTCESLIYTPPALAGQAGVAA